LEEKDEIILDYLKKWAHAKNVKIQDVVIYVYYDSPLLFTLEKCRRDICIVFDGIGAGDGQVKIKRFQKRKIAYLSFNGKVQTAYNELYKWLRANNYEITSPLRVIQWDKKRELQIGVKDTPN
jgi:DNA gyrase inhibitor GyrI